ncbi:DedA family protein [Nitrobacter sp.]|jgi:undecaprenyl-diphosphatase|uniref:DedA family protein n=1 Tax=Nitrobacter sp. TaxID=29420 RepID=UPI003F652871
MIPSIGSFLHQAADLVAQQPLLVIGFVFILALSESLPVVGAVVPGTATILTISAMAGGGSLPVWAVLLSACLGAIAGDGAAYWLGHSYQEQALRMWPMSRYPEAIRRSEEFFARHGGKSITIARFTPVVRAFVPLIAGVSGMNPRRFYTANIISAALWAISHIVPAAAAGASFVALHQHVGTLAVASFLLVGLAVLAWRRIHAGLRPE